MASGSLIIVTYLSSSPRSSPGWNGRRRITSSSKPSDLRTCLVRHDKVIPAPISVNSDAASWTSTEISGDLDSAKARVNPPIPPPLRSHSINTPRGKDMGNKKRTKWRRGTCWVFQTWQAEYWGAFRGASENKESHAPKRSILRGPQSIIVFEKEKKFPLNHIPTRS
jgi:hypothetical protein